jgi:hypothetical protein
MYRIAGDLDPATGLLAQTVLHALAAPAPHRDTGDGGGQRPDAGAPTADHPDGPRTDTDTDAARNGTGAGVTDGEAGGSGEAAGRGQGGWKTVRDERSTGQRLHDALRVACKKLLRAGELPMTGGLPATILITMTAEQYETKTGLAATSFGGTLRVPEALRLADEALIAWTVHGSTGRILAHGDTRRIATAPQTRALITRDQGCTRGGVTSGQSRTLIAACEGG